MKFRSSICGFEKSKLPIFLRGIKHRVFRLRSVLYLFRLFSKRRGRRRRRRRGRRRKSTITIAMTIMRRRGRGGIIFVVVFEYPQ